MRRGFPLLVCLVLLLSPATAMAKKKHRALGPVVPVSATGNTASGQGGISTAVATCPHGLKMIGGGFAIASGSPFNFALIKSFRDTPASWSVSAVESDSSSSGTVQALGYCRRSRRAISDVAVTGTVPGGLGTAGSASATCPSGSRVVAGGFEATNTDRRSAFPQTNMATGPSSWSLTSLNNSSLAQTITVHAYCLSGVKPTLVTGQTSSTLAQAQTETATSASCPKTKKSKKHRPRQRLSAGGFSTPTRSAPPFAVFSNSSAGPTGWVATALNATNTTGAVSATSQGICL